MMKRFCINFLAILATLNIVSCSPKIPSTTNINSQKIYYPKFSDTARFQYLRSFSSSTDIEIRSKFNEAIVGKKDLLWMKKPYGLTVKNDKIYITDIGLKGLNILDLGNNSYTQFTPVQRDLQFTMTSAIDDNNNRYIIDSKNNKAFIYEESGRFKKKIDLKECKRPIRIRIIGDKIYIADLGTNKLQIYLKSNFEYIGSFPEENDPTSDGFVFMPMDFDFDDNNIYILDAGSFEVKIYNYNGKLIKKFGKQGLGYGMFSRPKSIGVDDEGNILVADSMPQLIQIFNSKGQPLMTFAYTYEIQDNEFTPGLLLPTQLEVDYNNIEYFQNLVDPKYNLKYLVFVLNQLGANRLQVYGRIELKN